jgi:hypothetical protein
VTIRDGRKRKYLLHTPRCAVTGTTARRMRGLTRMRIILRRWKGIANRSPQSLRCVVRWVSCAKRASMVAPINCGTSMDLEIALSLKPTVKKVAGNLDGQARRSYGRDLDEGKRQRTGSQSPVFTRGQFYRRVKRRSKNVGVLSRAITTCTERFYCNSTYTLAHLRVPFATRFSPSPSTDRKLQTYQRVRHMLA